MSNLLYCRIHDIAKTDLEAANILAKNSLFPQAIYFYSQACEKAAKSVIAMNMIHREKKTDEEVLGILKSHNYGHNLLKLAETTTKIFVDYEKGLYLKRGGKETDELISTANELIKKIQDRKPDIQDLMAYYGGNVKVLYERLYSRLSENHSPIGAEHPYVGVLRELYKIPKTKYLKFNTLSQFLFILLDEMDVYS